MKWPTIKPLSRSDRSSPLYVRLLWMAAIWAASVLVLLAVAGVLRLILRQ